MTDVYFSRYMERAAEAAKDPSQPISDGELIAGIENSGSYETAAIAQAVSREAAMLAQALTKAGALADTAIGFSQSIPVFADESLKRGWDVGVLHSSVPYWAENKVQNTSAAHAFLDHEGHVYAYGRVTDQELVELVDGRITEVDGIALNRYAPACSTTMNDRSVLYGLAVLATANQLETRDIIL